MSVATAVQEAPRSAAPWIERTARVGYAGKGLLYLTTAGLALAAAIGAARTVPTGQEGAMRRLIDVPLGELLVGIIAVGLAGYGVWRIVMAIVDLEHDGRGGKGIALRIGYAASGLVHLALAASAIRAITTAVSRDAADEKRLSATALSIPGGRFVLAAIAIGIAAYALCELYRAVTSQLDKRLDLSRLSPPARRVLTGVARFGIAARAMVFVVIALFVGRAAVFDNPSEAGGVSESTRALFALGTLPYLAMALGLASYGIYQLVEARFRRIDLR